MVADTKDLPGGWTAANQIRARSYFDAAFIKSTANVELVSKYTTGMGVSCYVEILARAPFILIYPVDWHCGKKSRMLFPSTDEYKATRRTRVTG